MSKKNKNTKKIEVLFWTKPNEDRDSEIVSNRDLAQLEACLAHNRKDPGSKPGVAKGEHGI